MADPTGLPGFGGGTPASENRLAGLRRRWESEPGSRVFLQLAEEYRRLGYLPEAVEVLERGLQNQPSYLSAQVSLARCLVEMGDWEASAPVLHRVLDLDPTQLVAIKLLAYTYLGLARPDDAATYVDRYELLAGADEELAGLRARIESLRRLPTSQPGVWEDFTSPGVLADPAEPTDPHDLAAAEDLAADPEVLAASAQGFYGEGPEAPPDPAEVAPSPNTAELLPAAVAVNGDLFSLPPLPALPLMANLTRPRPLWVRRPSGEPIVLREPFPSLYEAAALAPSAWGDVFGRPAPTLSATTSESAWGATPAVAAVAAWSESSPAPVLDVEPAVSWSTPDPIDAVAGAIEEPLNPEPEAEAAVVVDLAPSRSAEEPEELSAAAAETMHDTAVETSTAAAGSFSEDVGSAPLEASGLYVEDATPAVEASSWSDSDAALSSPEAVSADVWTETADIEEAVVQSTTWSEDADGAADEPIFDVEVPVSDTSTPSELHFASDWEAEPITADIAAAASAPEDSAPTATVTLGELYLGQGHFSEAEAMFSAVLAREPWNQAAARGFRASRSRRPWPVDALSLLRGFRVSDGGLTAKKSHVLLSYLKRLRRG